MRLHVETDLTVRPQDGRMVHGTLVWLDGDKLEARLSEAVEPHELVDVRIDLRGITGAIVTQALVASVDEASWAGEHRTRMLLQGLKQDDADRLLDWADSKSQGRAPRDPLSWAGSQSMSRSRTGSGRGDIRAALREGIQRQVAAEPLTREG